MMSKDTVSVARDRHTFFISLTLLLLLVLFPILRADRYYSDDVTRAITGFYGWDANGRHLAMLVMRLLQFNLRHLVDISPLPQIGAIAVLAATSVLMARRYRIESPWLAALIAFPLGAQPFFLENLSYRFDALGMSLALFTAWLPFMAAGTARKGWILGAIALFASLCFYQPALTAFLIFTLMELVVGQAQQRPPRELIRTLAGRVAQCIVVMAAYQLLIAPTIEDWLKEHSATIRGMGELWVLKRNALDFYGYMAGAFNTHWLRWAGPLLLVMATMPALLAFRYARQQRSRWGMVLWPAVGLLIPFLATLSITLPMLPLRNPVILPRVFMGVGALLCAGLICICCAMRAWGRSHRWVMACATLWALGMASFAAVYGNSLGAQKALEERVASTLSNDVATLAAEHSVHYILIDGSVGLAPVTERAAQEFPLIRTLIFPYLREGDFHTSYYLRYYLSDTPELAREPGSQARVAAILAQACRAPVLMTRGNYAVRLVDDTVVATFPAGSPKNCS